MPDKNYYEILGVSKTANADELKSAYRSLAKKYHPDLYAGKSDAEKKAAEEKFKEINHAYDVLSDPQKRAAFDQYGSENGPQGFGGGDGQGFGGFSGFSGGNGGGFGIDMDDIINNFFGGFGGNSGRKSRANAPQRGQDILVGLALTFEEAAFGVEKTVNVKRVESCSECGGTGAKKGSGVKICTNCNGSGTVTQMQRTPFGQISTSGVCPVCRGKGKIISEPCPACGGQGRAEKVREVKINIPAGIDDGQRITYQGEGHAGANGGEKGSLVVEISVKPHKLFMRAGADLRLEVPISMSEAALGTTLYVPTLDKVEELKVPEGTQSGTIFKIKNKGIKKLRSKNDYGDLYVKVLVEVPKNLTREQKELLRRLDSGFDIKQFPRKKEYKDKI